MIPLYLCSCGHDVSDHSKYTFNHPCCVAKCSCVRLEYAVMRQCSVVGCKEPASRKQKLKAAFQDISSPIEMEMDICATCCETLKP